MYRIIVALVLVLSVILVARVLMTPGVISMVCFLAVLWLLVRALMRRRP